MTNLEIRKVKLEDLAQLKEIARQTFFETYAAGNTEENMKNYLAEKFSTANLKIDLADKNAVFYFATLDDQVIGYLKLNFGPSQTELQDANSSEIERIYVLKAFQGKKVGQALYHKAIKVSQLKNVDYVWLGVWEENPKAIKFYQKNGFVPFDKHLFILGNEEQTDIMMKLKLKK